MSTAIFSGDIITPLEEEINYNTLTSSFESGKEQRRSKWTLPKRRWNWQMRARSKQHMDYAWAFYQSRAGSYDTFYWENPNESPVTDEAVGTGLPPLAAFSLDHYPVHSGDVSISVGGVAKTEATDYTLNYTTGAITFVTPPPTGDAVVADSYRFYRVVRFDEDKLTKSLFAYQLFNSSVKIIEVL